MEKVYRHGEILFRKIFKKDLPKNLKETKQKEFLKGSHGNPHTFDNGHLYLINKGEFIFGYFIADNTNLFHKEHGNGKGKLKKAKLPNGVYELRKQIEYINDKMKPVID